MSSETKFDVFTFDDCEFDESFRALPLDVTSISRTFYDDDEEIFRGCPNPILQPVMPSLSPRGVKCTLAPLSIKSVPTVDDCEAFEPLAPLLPCPPYILETTHFASSKDLAKIIEELKSSFSLNDVDFVFNPLKSKFKAAALLSNRILRFSVRIFRDEVNQQHVVEFLKRQGSSFLWHQLYHSITADMLPYSGKRCSKKLSFFLVQPEQGEEDPEVGEVDDYLHPSIEMINSRFAEVQSEGIRNLADFSTVASTALTIFKPGVLNFSTLSMLLRSGDVEICTAAAMLIRNLAAASANEPDVNTMPLQQLAPSLVSAMRGFQFAVKGSGSRFAVRSCVAATLAVVGTTREAAASVVAAGGIVTLRQCASYQPSTLFDGRKADSTVPVDVKRARDATRALSLITQYGIST